MDQSSSLETLVVNFSLAVKYGLDESIIIQFLLNMISQHKRMNRNCYQDRTWNYCSRRELAMQFAFWSEKEVRTRLDNLVKKGILIKRTEGAHSWNKKNFYAFANEEEFGFSKNSYVGPNGPIERPKRANLTLSNTLSYSDIDKDNIRPLKKILPLSTEGKQKDNVSPAKRWRLTPDQEIIYEWLKDQNINSEDRILCLWSKTYSVDRLFEVIEYAKKKCKTNLGGYINRMLYKGVVVPNEKSEANKEFLEKFLETNFWSGIVILERYAKITMHNGYEEELPYNLNPEEFQRKVISLHEREGG